MPKIFVETGFRFLWVSLIAIILDQWTKIAIVDAMHLGQSIQILPFFNFTYVHNYGAAFSILYDAGGWQRYFLSAVAFIVSTLILWWMYKAPKTQSLLTIAFAFILGGAIGNLIDRMMHGYVIDFLDFYYKNSHWPAFNIADSSIFIGAVLLIIDMIVNKHEDQNEQ